MYLFTARSYAILQTFTLTVYPVQQKPSAKSFQSPNNVSIQLVS